MRPEVRDLLRRASLHGWVRVPWPGRHIRLRHEPTGTIVTLPSTPSDIRSLKNSEAFMARVSGRMRPTKGSGDKEAKQRLRDLNRQREAARHRRRPTVADVDRRPPRTAMEVAFEDFFTEKFAPESAPADGDRRESA
jgi:predicted RNA binding protein YcfA (HicA-like mRNA interferase family)